MSTQARFGPSERIMGVYTGVARERWIGRPPSGIGKTAVHAPASLTARGFVGDEQADLKVHGGPEKAVHHYPSQHYKVWASEGWDALVKFSPGDFGENIATLGFDETNTFIGDILRMGTALVQVTQGRTPCWKLNMHTGLSCMAGRFLETGYTGWYYRVIEDGKVKEGDYLQVVERPNTLWTVHVVTQARAFGNLNDAAYMDIASISGLSQNWKIAFRTKASIFR